MSDRTDPEVRKLAEEIAHAYKRELPTFALVDLPATEDLIEPLILAFQSQREAALQAQVHRALGEGARLRGLLEESLIDVLAASNASPESTYLARLYDRIQEALSASPLSERAGAVLAAVIGLLESPGENPSRVLLEGQRLRAELQKGGESG